MESLRIRGGVRLEGSVRVDGAKNAALPACIAALLTDEEIILHRVPQLRDVSTILYTLGALGQRVVRHGDHVAISGGERLRTEADAFSVRQMRASFLVLGPLVARLGRAVVPLPGGCAIGRRPVDLHLDGLRALGARIEEEEGRVTVTAARLIGGRVELSYPSVGATEQVMMAACLADGETEIAGGAVEPEVEDLAELLRKMGADISRHGRTIRVRGQARLGGAEHTLIPDRMEAGTFLLAGAITAGRVRVEGVCGEHLASFLRPLEGSGARVEIEANGATVTGPARPLAIDIVTGPHPGFPTDLHPPFAAYLARAAGSSRVTEAVFDDRFAYTDALVAMGARIRRAGDTVTIDGVDTLRGREVAASDIRAGAALALAGLVAQGLTTVTQLEQIDRGYSDLVGKLRNLGAEIERGEAEAAG